MQISVNKYKAEASCELWTSWVACVASMWSTSFPNVCVWPLQMSSMQVCYCGWSKVTTYQGLRIHQGKMGCTPRGMGIPEREQIGFPNYITSSNIGSNSWITPVQKEVHSNKCIDYEFLYIIKTNKLWLLVNIMTNTMSWFKPQLRITLLWTVRIIIMSP